MGHGVAFYSVILSILFLMYKCFHSKYFENMLIHPYIPKKMKDIYEDIFFEKGIPKKDEAPDTLSAYKNAILTGKGIFLNVRMLTDGVIICTDKYYLKRLVGISGKIHSKKYSDIKDCHVIGSKECVPTIKEALKLINGKVPIIIQVNGRLKKSYWKNLDFILKNYKGRYVVCTTSIYSFFIFRFISKRHTIFRYNIFRKHLNILDVIKADVSEYITLDILNEFVLELKESDKFKDASLILKRFSNARKSNINSNHWLNNSIIVHRFNVNNMLEEHSIESLNEAIVFAKRINRVFGITVAFEIDVVRYVDKQKNVKTILYHEDRVSDKLGQEASTAKKSDIENALTLEEFLQKIIIPLRDEKIIKLVIDVKATIKEGSNNILYLIDPRVVNNIIEVFNDFYEKKDYSSDIVIMSYNSNVVFLYLSLFMRKKYIYGKKSGYNRVPIGIVANSLSGVNQYLRNVLVPIVELFQFRLARFDFKGMDPQSSYRWGKTDGITTICYVMKNSNELINTINSNKFDNFVCEDLEKNPLMLFILISLIKSKALKS
ncbi:MAG: hypothetical protein RSE00_00075 [Clostridia bacterium]